MAALACPLCGQLHQLSQCPFWRIDRRRGHMTPLFACTLALLVLFMLIGGSIGGALGAALGAVVSVLLVGAVVWVLGKP